MAPDRYTTSDHQHTAPQIQWFSSAIARSINLLTYLLTVLTVRVRLKNNPSLNANHNLNAFYKALNSPRPALYALNRQRIWDRRSVQVGGLPVRRLPRSL